MKLLETIRIEEGRVMHINYHNDRCNESRAKFFKSTKKLNLRYYIKLKEEHKKGIYKCRIIFEDKVEKVEILPYTQPVIKSFKLIDEKNEIKYDHKFLERDQLDQLYAKRGNADEIIILQNELVTDAYYYNLVFQINDEYITPRTPLLNGTMRQYLLDHHTIELGDISKRDILNFDKVHFINALNPLGKVFIEF